MNETSDAAELVTQWRDHLRDVLQSFMCIDSEPKCIRDLPAVIQHSSFECSDKLRTQRLRIKHRVPFHPIADCGEHAAVSIQQMPDRQRRTVIGQRGNVFPDRIVDTEVSILLQQYERCGRELLRD